MLPVTCLCWNITVTPCASLSHGTSLLSPTQALLVLQGARTSAVLLPSPTKLRTLILVKVLCLLAVSSKQVAIPVSLSWSESQLDETALLD